MTEKEMYLESFKRPKNYFELSERQQWEIDSNLGILDWEGNDLTEYEREQFQNYYK